MGIFTRLGQITASLHEFYVEFWNDIEDTAVPFPYRDRL